MASVSDFIELAPNENVVKEYRSFRMKRPQNATVNIAATNMRLIFYGQSGRGRKTGRPTLTQEIRIEDIRGVEIYEKEKPNAITAIIGVIIIAAAVIIAAGRAPSVYTHLAEVLGRGWYGPAIIGVIGLIVLVVSFVYKVKEFEIIVKGKNSNLNTGMFSEKTVFKQGVDSPRILRELGSIILQIQAENEGWHGSAYSSAGGSEFSVEEVAGEEETEEYFEEEREEEDVIPPEETAGNYEDTNKKIDVADILENMKKIGN